MLRIAICESVRWDQDYLKKIVSGYMDQRGICCSIQCFGGGFEFLDYVSSRGRFHIALINASMERFNGIETAKELREYDRACQIIFVSFTDEFAISAYSVGAQSYLLKPVTRGELDQALDNCVRIRRERDLGTLVVKMSSGYYSILYRDIVYLESSGHKIIIHLSDGNCLTVYGRLDDYEDSVNEDPRFVRIHKSTLVNADYIFFIGREEILLYDKTALKISRNLIYSDKEQYFTYLHSKQSRIMA